MRTLNRTAIMVIPKQPLLDWLRSVDPTGDDLTLDDLRREPTIYLLAEAESDPETLRRLALVCDQIFEAELEAWYHAPEERPADRGMNTFGKWFTYSFHSVVVDMCDDGLVTQEL
jgi:hypothetical protein